MAIKAAVGVSQLDDALNQVHVRKGFLAELYSETMFTEITTPQWFAGVEKGQTVEIRHAPQVEFKDYDKDMKLEVVTPKVCTTRFGVHHAGYSAMKFDDVDQEYLMEYGNLRSEFENSVRRQANESIERNLFHEIYKNAHIQNQGSTAGDLGNYDQGEIGNDFVVTPDNFVDLLSSNAGTMDDQNVPEGNRWIVLPKQMKQIFTKAFWDKTQLQGSCGICTDSRTGKIYTDLLGFDIYFSSFLPRCIDPITNRTTWITPFGNSEGLAYTADLTKFEVIRAQDTFGDILRILITYGMGVGRPEMLGYNYISINASGG